MNLTMNMKAEIKKEREGWPISQKKKQGVEFAEAIYIFLPDIFITAFEGETAEIYPQEQPMICCKCGQWIKKNGI